MIPHGRQSDARASSSAAARPARDLRDLDLAGLTPREAMDWLFARQEELGG